MLKQTIIIIITGFLIISSNAEEVDFNAILSTIDDFSNFEELDLKCNYRLISQKPGKETRVVEFTLFLSQKQNKLLLIFLKPALQKGQGYLRINDNIWFYDSENRKFLHSSAGQNIQNSEVKHDDLNESTYSGDYQVENAEHGKLGKFPVYILTLKAIHDEVMYPKLKIWIRKNNYLILKREDYSFSDRLMRTLVYPKYNKINGKYIPSKILFLDELNKGEKTQLTISDIVLNKLPNHIFTKSYLESQSR